MPLYTLHGEGATEPQNVLCYLPVKEMCYFPDLTVTETLCEVSSIREWEVRLYFFPQN